MPRQIRLTFLREGVTAVADLLEEAAPVTCAAVWEALPVAGDSHHAAYSGSECVLVLPELLRLDPENATADVEPGDVCFTWFAAGSSYRADREFAEICWFYDTDAKPSMPEGPVPVSRFARLREGSEAFYAVCRRMRREGIKSLAIDRIEAAEPAGRERGPLPLDQIRMLAGRFAAWQTPFGRPDPERCPFVTLGKCISTQFHSPAFMATALYRAFEVTGDAAYKAAADRYVTFYFACLRDPPAGGQRLDYPSYPFQYGMALGGYRDFRRHNPEETSLDGKAAAIYEWLLRWRWDEGSYFRNSYGSEKDGVPDCGFSDDNTHMGRGLMGYYEVSGRPEVLEEAKGLARYYLTEAKLGSYQGCWSSAMGTWVVAPTMVAGFEHFHNKPSIEMGWGFSATGAVEYLTQLASQLRNADIGLRSPDRASDTAAVSDQSAIRNSPSAILPEIAQKCATSVKWQFDACQFDDGACGMRGRDDKWLGMTAGAILSFLRVRDAGFLSAEDVARYRPRARAAVDWLRAQTTPEAVDAGGYIKVTGESEPRPPENLAWLLAWTAEALIRSEDV